MFCRWLILLWPLTVLSVITLTMIELVSFRTTHTSVVIRHVSDPYVRSCTRWTCIISSVNSRVVSCCPIQIVYVCVSSYQSVQTQPVCLYVSMSLCGYVSKTRFHFWSNLSWKFWFLILNICSTAHCTHASCVADSMGYLQTVAFAWAFHLKNDTPGVFVFSWYLYGSFLHEIEALSCPSVV